MLRLRRVFLVHKPSFRVERVSRGRFCASTLPPSPPKKPPEGDPLHEAKAAPTPQSWTVFNRLDDDRFHKRILQLSREGWTRTLGWFLLTVVVGGSFLWFIYGRDLKEKASKDATAAVTATIASEEVTKQVQALSKDVVNSLLNSTETQQWTSKLSKAVVADLINDPVTQEQVAKLLQRAVVQPDSTAALVVLLQDLVKQSATTKLINELALSAVHTVLNDESIRQHASQWVQSVLNDEALQKHGGDAIWGSVTAALTPSWAMWFRKKEEEAGKDTSTTTEVPQGPEAVPPVIALDPQPGEMDLAKPLKPPSKQEEIKPEGDARTLSRVRSWFSWGRKPEALERQLTLPEVPPPPSILPLPTVNTEPLSSSLDSSSFVASLEDKDSIPNLLPDSSLVSSTDSKDAILNLLPGTAVIPSFSDLYPIDPSSDVSNDNLSNESSSVAPVDRVSSQLHTLSQSSPLPSSGSPLPNLVFIHETPLSDTNQVSTLSEPHFTDLPSIVSELPIPPSPAVAHSFLSSSPLNHIVNQHPQTVTFEEVASEIRHQNEPSTTTIPEVEVSLPKDENSSLLELQILNNHSSIFASPQIESSQLAHTQSKVLISSSSIDTRARLQAMADRATQRNKHKNDVSGLSS